MGEASGGETRWVLSLLVKGDRAGVMAVTAEGAIKSALWGEPDGAQPICSTVARFEDLSEAERDRWEEVLRRDGDFS